MVRLKRFFCARGENVFCEANHDYKFSLFRYSFLSPVAGVSFVTFALIGIVVQAVVEAQREEDPRKSHCWLTWVLNSNEPNIWCGFLLTHWIKINLKPFPKLIKGTGR